MYSDEPQRTSNGRRKAAYCTGDPWVLNPAFLTVSKGNTYTLKKARMLRRADSALPTIREVATIVNEALSWMK